MQNFIAFIVAITLAYPVGPDKALQIPVRLAPPYLSQALAEHSAFAVRDHDAASHFSRCLHELRESTFTPGAMYQGNVMPRLFLRILFGSTPVVLASRELARWTADLLFEHDLKGRKRQRLSLPLGATLITQVAAWLGSNEGPLHEKWGYLFNELARKQLRKTSQPIKPIIQAQKLIVVESWLRQQKALITGFSTLRDGTQILKTTILPGSQNAVDLEFEISDHPACYEGPERHISALNLPLHSMTRRPRLSIMLQDRLFAPGAEDQLAYTLDHEFREVVLRSLGHSTPAAHTIALEESGKVNLQKYRYYERVSDPQARQDVGASHSESKRFDAIRKTFEVVHRGIDPPERIAVTYVAAARVKIETRRSIAGQLRRRPDAEKNASLTHALEQTSDDPSLHGVRLLFTLDPVRWLGIVHISTARTYATVRVIFPTNSQAVFEFLTEGSLVEAFREVWTNDAIESVEVWPKQSTSVIAPSSVTPGRIDRFTLKQAVEFSDLLQEALSPTGVPELKIKPVKTKRSFARPRGLVAFEANLNAALTRISQSAFAGRFAPEEIATLSHALAFREIAGIRARTWLLNEEEVAAIERMDLHGDEQSLRRLLLRLAQERDLYRALPSNPAMAGLTDNRILEAVFKRLTPADRFKEIASQFGLTNTFLLLRRITQWEEISNVLVPFRERLMKAGLSRGQASHYVTQHSQFAQRWEIDGKIYQVLANLHHSRFDVGDAINKYERLEKRLQALGLTWKAFMAAFTAEYGESQASQLVRSV